MLLSLVVITNSTAGVVDTVRVMSAPEACRYSNCYQHRADSHGAAGQLVLLPKPFQQVAVTVSIAWIFSLSRDF